MPILLPATRPRRVTGCRHERAHVKGVPMPVFKKLTPNLLVANVERSLAFYVETLGFTRGMTVPDASPFVFASVVSGDLEIFFNDAASAEKEYPAFAGKPIGATATMFIELAEGGQEGQGGKSE